MRRVLCIGDACADITIPYGAAKLGDNSAQPQFFPGGTVANTASGLGRLGVDCAFLCKAGTDYYGRRMCHALRRDGVDTTRFYLDETLVSTQILAVIDEQRDRFTFLMPYTAPSYLELSAQDIPESLADEFDAVFTSGLLLFRNPAAENVCNFLEHCAQKGVPVFLDVNLRVETRACESPYLRRVLDCASYVFASAQDELLPLTGCADVDSAARQLVTQRRSVVARMGADGAAVYSARGVFHCDSFPVAVVDTLGAGDCYNSAFLFALTQGWDDATANRCGCAAAALCISRAGARNGPSEATLRSFLAAHGVTLPPART